MQTKDILIWLCIFIIGSLIVSFLIYPESFDSFKEKVKSIKPPSNNILSQSTIQYLDLKDYQKNQEFYLGKEIKIYAKFTRDYLCFGPNYHPNCDVFLDEEGYTIDVISDRKFEAGKKYEIEGTIIKFDFPNMVVWDQETTYNTKYYLKET